MTTLINVILDRSGSMGRIQEEAVGMYNRFLDEQKALPDPAELTLIQFDDKYEVDYERKPIKDCDGLVLGETYTPRGMTALHDAVGKTVHSISNPPEKVLFIILTDGEENASREYNGRILRNLIEDKKKLGWDFIFLAAGLDAFKEGAKFGMDLGKTADFDANAKGMFDAGATMSAYATQYRATGDNTKAVRK